MPKLTLFKADVGNLCSNSIKLAEEVSKEVDSVKLEVHDLLAEKEIAEKFNVKAVPTFLIDDEIYFTGNPTKDELIRALKKEQFPIEIETKRILTGLQRLVDSLNNSIENLYVISNAGKIKSSTPENISMALEVAIDYIYSLREEARYLLEEFIILTNQIFFKELSLMKNNRLPQNSMFLPQD